jgi:hypothetical protein
VVKNLSKGSLLGNEAAALIDHFETPLDIEGPCCELASRTLDDFIKRYRYLHICIYMHIYRWTKPYLIALV